MLVSSELVMDKIELIAGLIYKAKQAYYFSGEAIMTDAEYDALEDELKTSDPDHPLLKMVGAPVPADTHLQRVKHRMAMGSQSKVNNEGEFSNWMRLRGVGGEKLHVSLKADGCSIAAYYEKGRLVQIVSRGDGLEGEDVTANALCFRGIPITVPDGLSCAVRLEAVLTVEEWMRMDPDQDSNPRSLVNGILGRKDGKGAGSVTALAFDVDGATVDTESEKCEWLDRAGFRVARWMQAADMREVQSFWEEERRRREGGTAEHWSDGIVVKIDSVARQKALGEASGRPKGQVAWKFPSDRAVSTLEGIEWTVGHTGAITPVALIEPVRIGGTTVKRASLSNPEQIAALGLLDKSVVEVTKAGDIIPKITKVLEPKGKPIPTPTACPECGGGVGGVTNTDGSSSTVVYCQNSDCEAQTLGKIRRWAKSRDILGLGESVIEAICQQRGVSEVGDLLRLKAEDIHDVIINREKGIRLGEKRAENICAEIATKAKTMTLPEFLGAFGTRSLGVRRAQLMIAANPELGDLEKWFDGSLLDLNFSKRAGVPGAGALIFNSLKERETSIRAALAEIQLTQATVEAEGGKEICISGSLPSGLKKSDWEKPLRDAGFTLVDRVSKGLYALVVADPETETTKSRKASKLGVRIISEEALQKMVAGGMSDGTKAEGTSNQLRRGNEVGQTVSIGGRSSQGVDK